MVSDRAHEIRIIGLPDSPNTVAAARATVTQTLGNDWRVQRLTRGSKLVVITSHTNAVVGTDEHARLSHEATLALIRTRRFSKVEADVPVRGYAEQEAIDNNDGVGAFGALPLDWVHTILRWQPALDAMTASTRGGAGIVIGHPDTGYTLHPNLGREGLDLDLDRDIISGDNDALDDLVQNPLWPLPFPGHGTATASVIVGHGTPSAGIVGLLPKAKLVPIRATESVVQLFDSDVAKAVAHARAVGCHVVSMSLGGKGFFGLKSEIQRAVDSGMIVMAAAGNYVRFVTAPASYSNCIAVAATGPEDSLWDGSSRGAAVDVSMPGAQVLNAHYDDARQPLVGFGNGTSFAVAHLAAAAALWLAHHGRQSLINRYGAKKLQAAFLATLRWPGVCTAPPHWNLDWGIGRVDLLALLRAPLPASRDLDTVSAFGEPADDAIGRIAAALNADAVVVRTQLTALLGVDSPDELTELLDAHEGELVYLAYTDDQFAAAVSTPGDPAAFAPAVQTAGVSSALGALLIG